MNAAPLTPELEQTLRRYVAVQRQEQSLREEKSRLQDTLGQFMARESRSRWYPAIDGQPLKVALHEETVVTYDEQKLRERLGPRYAAILAADPRKIKRLLPELESALAPLLDRIGTPSPEKVRTAVEHGTVRKEEFAGAFTKSVRRIVAVMKARPDEPRDALDADINAPDA